MSQLDTKEYPPEVQELIDAATDYVDGVVFVSDSGIRLKNAASKFRKKKPKKLHKSVIFDYPLMECDPDVRAALKAAGVEVET